MGKIKDIIKEYTDYLLFEKGLSENTKFAYERDLSLFFYFLKEKEVESVCSEDLVLYIEYMEKSYSRFSVLRKITSIRNFFFYLQKEKVILKNPCDNLEKLKKGSYLPEVLTISEIKSIVESFGTTPKEKRDVLVLKLIIATGARVSEIIDILTSDIDSEGYGYTRVKGKGSKIRVIPIYKDIADELKFYIENIRALFLKNKDDKENRVFAGTDRSSFWRILQKKAKDLKIEKRVYPHIFRHSVATEMLKNGAGLRAVQEMLGHSSMTTTEIYTHLGKRDLKKAYLDLKIGDD